MAKKIFFHISSETPDRAKQTILRVRLCKNQSVLLPNLPLHHQINESHRKGTLRDLFCIGICKTPFEFRKQKWDHLGVDCLGEIYHASAIPLPVSACKNSKVGHLHFPGHDRAPVPKDMLYVSFSTWLVDAQVMYGARRTQNFEFLWTVLEPSFRSPDIGIFSIELLVTAERPKVDPDRGLMIIKISQSIFW